MFFYLTLLILDNSSILYNYIFSYVDSLEYDEFHIFLMQNTFINCYAIMPLVKTSDSVYFANLFLGYIAHMAALSLDFSELMITYCCHMYMSCRRVTNFRLSD